MARTRSAVLPRLVMYPLWDELRLNGQLINAVRPRSRSWQVLKALMRKAPAPVTTEDLFSICADTDTRDLKAAVHNVVRRLREALARAGIGALIRTEPTGGWRILALCEVAEIGSPYSQPTANHPEFTLG